MTGCDDGEYKGRACHMSLDKESHENSIVSS